MNEILLKLMNWLERTPNGYGRIDNINNYSREFIESYKGKTVNQFLKQMDRMDRCLKADDNCLIENGNITHNENLTNHF